MFGPTDAAPAIVAAGRAVTVRALDELAAGVRAGLASTVGPGPPLGIWIEDPSDFAAAVIAALALRVDVFLIPPEVSPGRVRELCAIESASAVLCDRARAARLGDGTRRACEPGLVLVETQRPTRSRHDADDQGSVHFFTSGTDGRPKAVVRSQRSIALEASTVGSHLGMAPGCAVLCTAPVAHAYGFALGLFGPLALGATAIIARPRMAASLAKSLTTHQPEVVVAVPAQYAAWSALRRSYDGPLPRLWVSSGAPLSPAVRARFEAVWGCVIAEQYGMTECGAVAIDLDATQTLGRPYPGVTVSIDRGGGGAPVGEVIVDTAYGASGYVAESGGQPGRFSTDGSRTDGFRTGDTGWLDADGRLHLVGRRAHQLNVRGQKVDPEEIERAFWALDGVHDVAVVGIDRADGDQWIAAFVVCAERITDEKLQQATAHLEGFGRPQRVVRLPVLPTTDTGKTDLAALRVAIF